MYFGALWWQQPLCQGVPLCDWISQSVASRLQKQPRKGTKNLPACILPMAHAHTPSVATTKWCNLLSPICSSRRRLGESCWPSGETQRGNDRCEHDRFRGGHLCSNGRGRILIANVNTADCDRIHVSTWCLATANSLLLHTLKHKHSSARFALTLAGDTAALVTLKLKFYVISSS